MRKLIPILLLLLFSPIALANWGTPVITHTVCTAATTCAQTVPSTGVGHLLVQIVKLGTVSDFITGMTGGSTGSFNGGASPAANTGPVSWYHPGGGGGVATNQCNSSDATVPGSIDCAYVLYSTAGSTTITATFNASTTCDCYIYEVAYGNSPIVQESFSALDNTNTGTTLVGSALTISGVNDFLIQGINAQQAATAISGGYLISNNTAYLSNSVTGTAPTWTLASSSTHAATVGIAFRENTAVTGLNNVNWITYARAGYLTQGSQCFNPSQDSVTTGGIFTITGLLSTTTCNSIDLAATANPYLTGNLAMRNFNFQYGTVEFRMKFGPCNALTCGGSGMYPFVLMFDAGCEPSDPTGTDNNCNGNEVDIAEILAADNGAAYTKINQVTHIAGTQYGCASNGGFNGTGTTAYWATHTITDASLNYHVYQLVWSAGSLSWVIDGTTTCTLTGTGVPASFMFLDVTMMGGGTNGGAVNNATFPWSVNVDYVKVIQSGVVIFEDDFNTPVAPVL